MALRFSILITECLAAETPNNHMWEQSSIKAGGGPHPALDTPDFLQQHVPISTKVYVDNQVGTLLRLQHRATHMRGHLSTSFQLARITEWPSSWVDVWSRPLCHKDCVPCSLQSYPENPAASFKFSAAPPQGKQGIAQF